MSLDGLRDPALHAVRRRPWARGMNSASMKYYEQLIGRTIGDLIKSFDERAGQVLLINQWMGFFA